MGTVLQAGHLFCHQKPLCEGSGIEAHMSIHSNKQEMEQAGFVMGSLEEAGNTLKHEGMVKRSYCCAY